MITINFQKNLPKNFLFSNTKFVLAKMWNFLGKKKLQILCHKKIIKSNITSEILWNQYHTFWIFFGENFEFDFIIMYISKPFSEHTLLFWKSVYTKVHQLYWPIHTLFHFCFSEKEYILTNKNLHFCIRTFWQKRTCTHEHFFALLYTHFSTLLYTHFFEF